METVIAAFWCDVHIECAPQGESKLVPSTEKILKKLESPILLPTSSLHSFVLPTSLVTEQSLSALETHRDFGGKSGVQTRYYCFLFCSL